MTMMVTALIALKYSNPVQLTGITNHRGAKSLKGKTERSPGFITITVIAIIIVIIVTIIIILFISGKSNGAFLDFE